MIPDDPEEITYSNLIQPLLLNRCGACHGESGQGGLKLSDYSSLMAGGNSGEVIIPEEPEASPLLLKTAGVGSHFASFTSQELEWINEWIGDGALE